MLDGFSYSHAEEESDFSEAQTQSRNLLNPLTELAPPSSSLSPPSDFHDSHHHVLCFNSSDLPLWIVFLVWCFCLSSFVVNRIHFSCWTARDELTLLSTLNNEHVNSPWPLLAAHSRDDHLQSRPLLTALELGFCSVGVEIRMDSNGTLVCESTFQDFESLYLEPLSVILSVSPTVLTRAVFLKTCTQFTIFLTLEESTELLTIRALEAVLAKYEWVERRNSSNSLSGFPAAVRVLVETTMDSPLMNAIAADTNTRSFVSLRVSENSPLRDVELGTSRRVVRAISTVDQSPQTLQELRELCRVNQWRLLWVGQETATSEVWKRLLWLGVNILGARNLDVLQSFLLRAAAPM